MKIRITIFLSKLLSNLIGFWRLGSGSTWPGHIALSIDRGFIRKMAGLNPGLRTIVVAGTNGKTTTAAILSHLLHKHGYRVLANPEGANLLNGVASSLVRAATLSGRLEYDFAVIEADEFSLPEILDSLRPESILLLNLFRDQLDRYGEVNTISKRWLESLKVRGKSGNLIVNGDDPQLAFIGKTSNRNTRYFGIPVGKMMIRDIPHDVDSIYCPSCFSMLIYKAISYAHLGDFKCPGCSFSRMSSGKETGRYPESPSLAGMYNRYNVMAAVTCLRAVLGKGFDMKKTEEGLSDFQPSFGRQEMITHNGRKYFIILSKNPAGFNQTISALMEKGVKNETFIILLNDRIPDGRDVSWIWDVDFEKLKPVGNKFLLSGERPYDMAVRLKYAGIDPIDILVIEDLRETVRLSALYAAAKKPVYILTTYSAMLEVRKILIGRKLM